MKKRVRVHRRGRDEAEAVEAAESKGTGSPESKRRHEILNKMYRDAKNGNAAKRKAFITMSLLLEEQERSMERQKPKVPDEQQQPKGKKAAAHAEAKIAEHGTAWDGLLNG